MLHSLLTEGGMHPVTVTYLHGSDFGPRLTEPITAMVDRLGGTIDFVPIPDEQVGPVHTSRSYPSPAWYRLFLPELLPRLSRVLYLDIDLVVVDRLEELWQTELGDHYLAAVTNLLEPHFEHRPATLGVQTHNYFNSGVMLMNLDRMRRDDAGQAVLDFARRRGDELIWVDQDALNAVLGDGRLPLHPRWNCMNSILTFPNAAQVFGAAEVEVARRHPAIRHFEGPAMNKPWHYMCDHAGRELYERHRRLTPWPHYRPEGRTPRNMVRRLGQRLRARVAA
jgi:UDP-glucose/galactose:(glucosyl)LPS alpha-1,2-glucosyl/galactosyltransferase